MKRILISLLVLLCSNFTTQAQQALSNIFSSEKITFPVNGSVFQMDNSDLNTHGFKFSGQTTSNFNLRFSLYKQTSAGAFTIESAYNNIPLTYKSCASGGCADGVRLFDYTGTTNLPKGWYRIVVYREYQSFLFTSIIRRITKSVVDFGVGDVYFIAGQSNASGWYWLEGPNLDNAISTTGETDKSSPMARTLTYREDNNGQNGNLQRITKGIPYNSNTQNFPNINFNELRNPATPSTATAAESGRINIYPNGYNSWAYGPLAYKMATNNSDGGNKFSGIPSLWFNCAVGGTSINTGMGYNSWQNNPDNETSLQGKLDYTIFNFGGPFGAKAVLWHQGEYDHLGYLKAPSSNSDFVTNYKNGLSKIIEYSRQSIDNSGTESSKLNWFISDVSYTPYSRINPAPSGSTGVDFTKPNGYIDASNTEQAHWTSATLKSTGQSTSLLRPTDGVFSNIPANSPHLNLFKGPLTDDMIGLSNRTNRFLIHFSGTNPLNELGQRWYNKLYSVSTNNSVSNVSIKASPLIPLLSVEKNGSTYTLKIPTQSNSVPNAPAIRYYWVRNSEVPVVNLSNPSGSSIGVFNNNTSGDYLVGYVFKDGRLHPVQPFLVPGGSAQSKNIRIAQNNLIIPASGGSVSTEVVAVACDWEIVNQPINFSVDYSEITGELLFSRLANSSGATISEDVLLKETGGTYYETINISQVSSSGSTIPLTSITPNSNSGWYRTNVSIDNGTLRVSGIEYFQGFGVHANNSLFFNLNGQYATFTGKVGSDDEADNSYASGNIQFYIKGDGAILWSSGIHNTGSNAEPFSVNVSGITTLELYTDISNDYNYFDHGDWLDLYLSTGPPTTCTNANPSNVYANPSTVSSSGGNTTLHATCPSGTVANWSSGQTGSSVTLFVSSTSNYTVTCTGNSCYPSNPVGVSVTVPPPGGCSNIINNQTIGTWAAGNGTTYPLVARSFNGQMWLTQRTSTNPETFLVRGSYMLTRPDVSTSFSSQIACFAWVADCSNCFGGLATPNSIEFPTPSGFTLGYECSEAPCNATNGTPYYYASSTPPPPNCTSSVYLTNSWTYGSAGHNPPPKVGTNIGGGNMTMGNVNYTTTYPNTGIGTHSTSEITYDLGLNHPYTHFLATVGKDNAALCGSQYGQEKLLFKVINNATGAVLATSPYVGNPNSGLPQTSNMSVSLSGVRYLKLLMEDGGDGGSCDWGNWARARLACSANGRVAAIDSSESIEFMGIVPNPNAGEFEIQLYLEEDSPLNIALLNSVGVIFETMHIQGQKGMNIIPYKTNKVGEGNYLLKVISNSKVQTQTVVIK